MSVLAADDFEDEGGLVLRFEGVAEGAEFVEQAAQGPDIALFVVRLLLAEFGREVERGADHGLRKLVASEHLGDPQVANFDFLVLVHEDVQSFDIPVQNLVLVDVLEAQADFDEEAPDFVLLQRPLVLRF